MPSDAPALDPEQRVWLFGYGYLMSEDSRWRLRQGARVRVQGEAFPAALRRITRGWYHPARLPEHMKSNASIPAYQSLGAVEDGAPSSRCVGVVFSISTAELAVLDEREVGYRRTPVSWSCVEAKDALGSTQAEAGSGLLFCYLLTYRGAPSPEYPLLQSYIDLLLAACAEISEAFALEFVRTTDAWPVGDCAEAAPSSGRAGCYLDDRAAPGYIRWSLAAQAQAAQWDALLEEEVPGLLSSRQPFRAPEGWEGKPVRVRIDEPWLEWIVSGPKTYEGRVWRGTWKKLMPGHWLDANSTKYASVALRVQEVLHFADFDAAFEALGASLVPEGASSPAEALQLYRRWNPEEAVRAAGGMVAVKVEVGAVQLHSHAVAAS